MRSVLLGLIKTLAAVICMGCSFLIFYFGRAERTLLHLVWTWDLRVTVWWRWSKPDLVVSTKTYCGSNISTRGLYSSVPLLLFPKTKSLICCWWIEGRLATSMSLAAPSSSSISLEHEDECCLEDKIWHSYYYFYWMPVRFMIGTKWQIGEDWCVWFPSLPSSNVLPGGSFSWKSYQLLH